MLEETFDQWLNKHGLSVDQSVPVLGISRANGFRYKKGSQDLPQYIKFAMETIDLLSVKQRTQLFADRISRGKVISASGNHEAHA